MQKKLLITYLLIISFPTTIFGKYDPYKVNELIDNSDVIVIGTIIKVNEGRNQFILSIDSLIFNKIEIKGKEIKVKIIKNCGTCPPCRWTPRKKGQKSLFFLKLEHKILSNHFSVLSAGNEGELPLIDKNIFIMASSCICYIKQNNIEVSQLRQLVYDYKFLGLKMNIDTFLEAVKTYIQNRKGMQNREFILSMMNECEEFKLVFCNSLVKE